MFERIRTYVSLHRNELAITGVMLGISLAVSVALASGDIGEALARRRQ